MHRDDASRLTWSIGAVARHVGLPVKVVRHWSDVGVVTPVGRTGGGYRRYDTAGVARLHLARTLRDLGMGLKDIRAALDREDGLTEVAAAHVEALEAQIRRLRTHQAVLRTVTRRTTHEGLALMTRTAHLSPGERRELVHDFLTGTLGDLDVPHFREGLLDAGSDLPEDPTDEQVEAWLELGELIADGDLRPALRRMAEYAARQGRGVREASAAEEMRALTDTWTARVREAMRAGTAADSPAADRVVADVVAAWLPSRANTDPAVVSDGAEARALLCEQLTAAAEPAVERFWQLLCVLGGRPAPAGIAEEGRWLVTALYANPAPGARDAALEALYADDTDPWPGGVLNAFTRVQDTVHTLVRAATPDRFGLPTPCAAWTVRDLLDHLVWENIIWGGLAQGTPPAVGHTEDHLGDDHVAAFATAAAGAREAFLRPGMLDRAFGPAPGRRVVEQLLVELLVHGWDLATALGLDRDLEPDIARAALPVVRKIHGTLPRTAGGSIAPVRPAPGHAPALDRVAAFLGRGIPG
ncbi:TIGR03086 family metal-binding protein [Streptomyces sp. MB09-02B]|uniref:TIGR03086 family metal-binding protein n=1 Tax=Streptomyces sp. MB09-02B TaxID=3028667 RepID=UPI0029AC3840|nr:TIGR03086 family metal-binding protein [Streptomyces sp. MB09-02B]MDX3638513.1 TIGR03086 family metal-binding protein [Streptomyces sp. MB09-02B]